jgi:hypothetical protein
MKSADQKLHARAEKLRDAIAKAQGTVDHLQAQLRKIEAKIAGDPPVETGLDLLWDAAPAMARNRSSRLKCRTAWNRVPANERPRIPELIAALKAWSRCQEWRKDDGQFVPALDRWISQRKWVDLPEDGKNDVAARYRVTPKAAPKVDPADVVTDPAEIAKLLSTRPARMNS